MNRITLTLLCCVLGTAGAWAQQEHLPSTQEHTYHNPAWNIIRQQTARANPLAKTTGSGQELVCNTVKTGEVQTDSFIHHWSGGRDLAHYTNPEGITYEIHNAFSLNIDFPVNYFRPTSYHAFVPAESMFKPDNTLHYRGMPGNAPLFETFTYNYDAAGNVTYKHTAFASTQQPNVSQHYVQLAYDGSGGLIQVQSFADTLDDGIDNYFSNYTMYHDYNNGLLMRDSFVSASAPGSNYVTTYEHDAAGKDTVIRTTINGMKCMYVLQYYNDGRLHISTCYGIYSFGPAFWWSDIFDYNGNHPYPSFHILNVTGADEGSSYEDHYILNSAGDVIEYAGFSMIEGFGPYWDSVCHAYFYYNSFGNPDSIVTGTWDGNNVFTPRASVETFHYQPTGIYDAAKPAEVAIAVYPNPAHNEVVLQLPDDAKGTVGVYDAAGRVLLQYSLAYNGMKLDISRLPIGMYLVQYSGGNGGVGTARFVKE